jgi:hypothetical protein
VRHTSAPISLGAAVVLIGVVVCAGFAAIWFSTPLHSPRDALDRGADIIGQVERGARSDGLRFSSLERSAQATGAPPPLEPKRTPSL